MSPVADTDYNEDYALTFSSYSLVGSGVDQGDLYDLFNAYITNFNATLTKLDADSGVTDTTYNSLWALDVADIAGYGLNKTGMYDGSICSLMNDIKTKFSGVTAKLDADAGVEDTDYASTLDFSVPTDILTIDFEDQGSIVDYMTTVTTQFNTLLTKLDADAA